MGHSSLPLQTVSRDGQGVRSVAAPVASEGMSISIDDVYYIVFRHKVKIILCALVGLAAAGAVYKTTEPIFISDAKLFIRFVVVEGMSQRPTPGDDTVTKSPDMRGETIMSSEQEILTSLDLAKQVAQVIGPEKILAKSIGGSDVNFAALTIRGGLQVDVPRFGSVITISFRHPDVELVQPVLREIVSQYFKKHLEIHRASGMAGDFLSQETDQLRGRLTQTEDELRKAKSKAGVVSLDEAKQTTSAQIAAIRQQIFAIDAELAQRLFVYDELTKLDRATSAPKIQPLPAPEVPSTLPKVDSSQVEQTDHEPDIAQSTVDEYRGILTKLELLRRREQDLLVQFTPENPRVKEVSMQIADAQSAKRVLEAAHPSFLSAANKSASVTAASSGPQAPPIDLPSELIRINSIKARQKVLNSQLETLRVESEKLGQLEGNIRELTRKKDLEETNYRRYAASLEQSRINEALGSGKVSNIGQIQVASAPRLTVTNAYKLPGQVAGGGLALGLVWAFLLEMFLDRSVRRPVEVEKKLKLPLFISIPNFVPKPLSWWQRRKAKRLAKRSAAGAKNTDVAVTAPTGEAVMASPPSAGARALLPFHETLRDRLIAYFESQNLTHKPKLVAVTGLGGGSGVTTIAAGLAQSLSETGEGNVLLVDMTGSQGSAQQFTRGKVACGLDEILGSRDSAHVQQNLYVVTDNSSSEQLSRNLPLRFTKLIPKLKASDFDYIIFDMPAVSQLSITPRLAGFMDIVLFVLESEKTSHDAAMRATAMLAKSTGHIGAVLNKTKSYVPAALLHEYSNGG